MKIRPKGGCVLSDFLVYINKFSYKEINVETDPPYPKKSAETEGKINNDDEVLEESISLTEEYGKLLLSKWHLKDNKMTRVKGLKTWMAFNLMFGLMKWKLQLRNLINIQ